MVKICKGLPEEEKRRLISLLREFGEVFTWKYEKMRGLDPKLVTPKLNVDPKAKHVKQLAKKYNLDVEEKIKVEVIKLFHRGDQVSRIVSQHSSYEEEMRVDKDMCGL